MRRNGDDGNGALRRGRFKVAFAFLSCTACLTACTIWLKHLGRGAGPEAPPTLRPGPFLHPTSRICLTQPVIRALSSRRSALAAAE